MASFGLHGCTDISTFTFLPADGEHGSALTLAIKHRSAGITPAGVFDEVADTSHITLFNLPTEITDVFLENFGDPNARAANDEHDGELPASPRAVA